MKKQTLHIKGMLTNCSKSLVKIILQDYPVHIKKLTLGQLTIEYNEKDISYDTIIAVLKEHQLNVVQRPEDLLVDRIKQAVIDLVFHMNNMNSIVQKSEYLVEILKMSYEKISREFNKNQSITLEKFIISVKIERIKELLDNGDYSLSEIAFMMDYSSVAHLSGQFKKVTNITISEYKKLPSPARIPLDEL